MQAREPEPVSYAVIAFSAHKQFFNRVIQKQQARHWVQAKVQTMLQQVILPVLLPYEGEHTAIFAPIVSHATAAAGELYLSTKAEFKAISRVFY